MGNLTYDTGATCPVCEVWIPSGLTHDHALQQAGTPDGAAPLLPSAIAEVAFHKHRWVHDGVTPGGSALYHCDAHDPPEVRTVSL